MKNLMSCVALLLSTHYSVNAQSWTAQTSGVSTTLEDVQFVNGDTGVACGRYGVILRTVDGGKTWSSINSNTMENLWGIDFTNESTGFVVGNAGTILKTVDAGVTWSEKVSGTSHFLHDVEMLNDTLGFAAGDYGTILKTTDAGESWLAVSSGTTFPLYDVCFVSNTTGFISAGYSTFLTTTDGGSNWTVTDHRTLNSYYAVQFIDEQVGFLGGTSGLLLKTIDGGANWSTLTTTSYENVNDILIVDANTLFVVHDDGAIGYSLNAGQSFSSENTGTTKALKGICQVDQKYWAVGSSGTILHKELGVCVPIELTADYHEPFICEHDTLRMEVSATGTDITYSWLTADYGKIYHFPNSDSSVYINYDTDEYQGYRYFCMASNNCSADTILVADVTMIFFDPYFDYEVNSETYEVSFTNYSGAYNAEGLYFEWTFDTLGTSTEVHPVYQFDTTGIYYVCFSIYDTIYGCFNQYCLDVVVEMITGLSSELNAESRFIVYPNPVYETLQLEGNFDDSFDATIRLTDALGNLVREFTTQALPSTGQPNSLNMTGVDSGIYFLKITTPQHVYTQKIIKR